MNLPHIPFEEEADSDFRTSAMTRSNLDSGLSDLA
jgi:hypothetical protein